MGEQKDDNYNSERVLHSDAKPGQFASLSMHGNDCIRLLDFPFEIQNEVREVIIKNWSRGIQSERTYMDSHEFKLCGYPWACRSGDAITSRRLITALLEALHNLRWIISISGKATSSTMNQDSLFFQYQPSPPDRFDWMCIGLAAGDRLYLVDAPLDLIKTVMQNLNNSIQSDLGYSYLGAYELKLKGFPWTGTSTHVMPTHQLLLKIFSALHDHGWSIYASADQRYGTSNDADTWHCRRHKNWMPEVPSYSPN
ncbi:hypothetical protein F5Y19DRAFT_415060 [Xylariaceae sp. FL1651]|nr:hypothetical protein F5Y19DRAFT_415060 [Xylariaceae sp. FL1651]